MWLKVCVLLLLLGLWGFLIKVISGELFQVTFFRIRLPRRLAGSALTAASAVLPLAGHWKTVLQPKGLLSIGYCSVMIMSSLSRCCHALPTSLCCLCCLLAEKELSAGDFMHGCTDLCKTRLIKASRPGVPVPQSQGHVSDTKHPSGFTLKLVFVCV